jgi:hypothetical protein
VSNTSPNDIHQTKIVLRIIVCGDGIQWVLQSWRAPLWRNRSFCMTSAALRRDAPRPGEIVLCMAIADGSRPHPRVGSGPITD